MSIVVRTHFPRGPVDVRTGLFRPSVCRRIAGVRCRSAAPLVFFLCAVFTSVGAPPAAAADFDFIDLDSIERIEAYRTELEFFTGQPQFFSGWIPDEHWNAPFGKDEARTRVQALETLVEDNAEPENFEYLLLRAAVAETAYHLDVEYRFVQTVSLYREAAEFDRRETRARWMLAVFYRHAACMPQSIALFRELYSEFGDFGFHPSFFLDFATTAYMANMRFTALLLYEKYFLYTGETPDDFPLYTEMVSNTHAVDAGQSLGRGEVYIPYQVADGPVLVSYPLGIRVGFDPAWNRRYGDWANGNSALMFQPAPVAADDGRSVGYTLLILSSTHIQETIDRIYTLFSEVERLEVPEGSAYELYGYREPSSYAEMGGARGYVAFYRSPVPAFPGTAIEEPFVVETNNQKTPTYTRMSEVHGRVPAEIIHMVMLDACELIIDEAGETFFNLLNGIRVE